jgi:hypothetical protein
MALREQQEKSPEMYRCVNRPPSLSTSIPINPPDALCVRCTALTSERISTERGGADRPLSFDNS